MKEYVTLDKSFHLDDLHFNLEENFNTLKLCCSQLKFTTNVRNFS